MNGLKAVRFIYLFCMFFFFNFGISSSVFAVSIAKQIMHQNLNVYPYEELDWPSDDHYGEFLTCVIDSQQNLQEFVLRRTTFLMYDRYVTRHAINQSDVLRDPIVWNDLNLFCGQNDVTRYLADKVDQTSTMFGKVFLYDRLAQPSSDKAWLHQFQSNVRTLVDDPELLENIVRELQAFEKSQSMMLSFWTNDPFKQAAQRKYFTYASESLTNILNNSSFILNCRLLLEHANRWCVQIGGNAVATGLLPFCGLSIIADYELSSGVKENFDSLQAAGGPFFTIFPRLFKGNTKFLAMVSVCSGIAAGLGLRSSVEWACDQFLIEEYMHKKMRHVSWGVQRLKNIRSLIRSNPAFECINGNSNGLEKLFSKGALPEIKELLCGLKSDDITKKLSLFTNKGKMMVTFRQFCLLKDEFEDALMTVGEIDMMVSVARLIKESETSQQRYSFVEFQDNQQPYVALEDFWNPFIDPNKAVANSIVLGGPDHCQNIIITGPNAGGKSTMLKAVTINIILAQSFGIVAARSGSLTLFDKIMTYLNVIDDIAAGNSLFKAQVLRAQLIVDMMHQCSAQGKKMFAALDEMFNSTSPREAEACAYSVAKDLGACPFGCTAVVSHHPLVASLAQETDYYENLQVSVIKNPDGTLTYPFKLAPGVSSQHIALDILRNEGFSGSILQDAQLILNRKASRSKARLHG